MNLKVLYLYQCLINVLDLSVHECLQSVDGSQKENLNDQINIEICNEILIPVCKFSYLFLERFGISLATLETD